MVHLEEVSSRVLANWRVVWAGFGGVVVGKFPTTEMLQQALRIRPHLYAHAFGSTSAAAPAPWHTSRPSHRRPSQACRSEWRAGTSLAVGKTVILTPPPFFLSLLKKTT